MTFVRLNRDWVGRNVVLIGGGPSLRGFDFERLRGKAVVVAINDAIRVAPWADVAFTIDAIWLEKRALELAAFQGEKLAAVANDSDGLSCLHRRSAVSLSLDMTTVCTGGNSGFAALGMAMMRGAARIALLGYDMNGKGHFHGGYDWYCRFGSEFYPHWVKGFVILGIAASRSGIQIVNCNPASAIKCFRFGKIEDIIQ